MSTFESKPRLDNELWIELHEWFVNVAKDKEADVLFIGDDHIAMLEQSQFYSENLAPLHCLCFGAFGDKLANLHWRIENGEAENFTPKVIIVSIGHSDVNCSSTDEFLARLVHLAKLLKEKQPKAELAFLQLLPSGRKINEGRKFVNDVNSKLKDVLAGHASVIEVDPSLIDQNGEIDAFDFFDFSHLSQNGYRKVFMQVLSYLQSSSDINP